MFKIIALLEPPQRIREEIYNPGPKISNQNTRLDYLPLQTNTNTGKKLLI